MHLKLLVHLLQKLDVLGRQMTKLIDDGLRRLRRLQPVVRFLDNLFLPRDRGDAVHQQKQVYLDGEGERNKSGW